MTWKNDFDITNIYMNELETQNLLQNCITISCIFYQETTTEVCNMSRVILNFKWDIKWNKSVTVFISKTR